MRLRNRNLAEPLQEMIPELPSELPGPFALRASLTMRRASSSCLPGVILRREVGALVSSRPKPAGRR